jgi:hypothetical protein
MTINPANPRTIGLKNWLAVFAVIIGTAAICIHSAACCTVQAKPTCHKIVWYNHKPIILPCEGGR